jgi:hypothetical protein
MSAAALRGDGVDELVALQRGLRGVAADALPLLEAASGETVAALRASLRGLSRGAALPEGPCWRAESEARTIRRAVMGTKRRMMVPMLNDARRNEAYSSAIGAAVAAARARKGPGRPVRVLDIGAGTGLLSLLAASSGATSVVGCEMNVPLAQVARDVVAANGLSSAVQIISERSSELVSCTNAAQAFDVVVTETLDSDLLDEGIQSSVSDALRRLCARGALVVPGAARVFCALGDASEMPGLNASALILMPGALPRACSDGAQGDEDCDHDSTDSQEDLVAVGLDKLCNYRVEGAERAVLLTEPRAVVDVDFSRSAPEPEGAVEVVLPVTRAGRAGFVLTWWELDVAPRESDAPGPGGESESAAAALPHAQAWTQAEPEAARSHKRRRGPELLLRSASVADGEADEGWQDHWFPVVVPLRRVIGLAVGEEVRLRFRLALDSVSLESLDVSAAGPRANGLRGGPDPPKNKRARVVQIAGRVGRERAAQLADESRSAQLRDALGAELAAARPPGGAASAAVLDLADGSLCSMLLLALVRQHDQDAAGRTALLSLEAEPGSRQLWSELCAGDTDGDEAEGDEKRVRFAPDGDALLKELAAEPAGGLLVASDLHYETFHGNALLGALLFWAQCRWLGSNLAATWLAPLRRACPARVALRAALLDLGKLAEATASPRNLPRALEHGPAVQLWSSTAQEAFPVPLWCYQHAFLSDPVTLCELHNSSALQRQGPGGAAGPTVEIALSKPRGQRRGLALALWADAPALPAPKHWFDKHLVRVLNDDDDHDAAGQPTVITILDALTLTVTRRGPAAVQVQVQLADL